jgi:hypothetical protein
MPFNIKQMHAARAALATAADNLRRYPWITMKLNHDFIYLPEYAQDKISVIVKSHMEDVDADTVMAIFSQHTCQTCNKVGRLCQCLTKAEATP